MQKTILLIAISLVSLGSLLAQRYTSTTLVKPLWTYFELYENNSTNAEMTVKSGKWVQDAKWDNLGSSDNVLIRESNRNGRANVNTKIVYNYNISTFSGNVYAGGYGWWKNSSDLGNMCEFYVVETWNEQVHATFGMNRVWGQDYYLDGSWYHLYYAFKNQGNVYSSSNKPFIQIKAIRQSRRPRSGKSSKYTLSMAKHFKKWEDIANANSNNSTFKQFKPRKIFENSFVFEGYGSSSKLKANFNAGFAYLQKSFEGEESPTENLAVTAPISDLTVYPNPASGRVTVKLSSLEPVTVSVFNMSGQLMSETTTSTGLATINADNSLPTGLYVVRTSEGASRKLVIK